MTLHNYAIMFKDERGNVGAWLCYDHIDEGDRDGRMEAFWRAGTPEQAVADAANNFEIEVPGIRLVRAFAIDVDTDEVTTVEVNW